MIKQITVAKATIILDLTDWLRAAISGASRSNQNKIHTICEICEICGPPKIISVIRGKRIISG